MKINRYLTTPIWVKLTATLSFAILTMGCISSHEVATFSQAKCIQYQPVIIKPHPARFYLQQGNQAALERAYQSYIKTGKAPNIITEGFVQFAYGAQQPILPASPLELTVISLEPGECVTNVSSGDPMRWSYSLAYSGDKIRQAHIMVKPSAPQICTDLVITTDRRFYTLKLVSKQDNHYYRDVRFWYPDDIKKISQQEEEGKAKKLLSGDSAQEGENQFDLEHLNFDYSIKCPFFGSNPQWYPIRVFDDGRQTFIQFPASISRTDLPALFIQTNHQMTLANYRMKTPYFIVDRLFASAVLISGCGREQQKITLVNQHWR